MRKVVSCLLAIVGIFLSLNAQDVRGKGVLFSDELKNTIDKELLDRFETEIFKLCNGGIAISESPVKIIEGSVDDFKSLTPATTCVIRDIYDKEIVAEWTLDNGKKLKVAMPVSYQIAKGGSRSEIENRLIEKLKSGDMCQVPSAKWRVPSEREINLKKLKPYGEDKYILPGESYLKEGLITRNMYFENDQTTPIWNRNDTIESIANLMLFTSDVYGDVVVELTVMKHEYGEKETLDVPLNTLLSVFEEDGCTPFWGIEKINGNNVEGALFFVNRKQGYNHLVRVNLDFDKLFSGQGEIKSRASLYVPINNVDRNPLINN